MSFYQRVGRWRHATKYKQAWEKPGTSQTRVTLQIQDTSRAKYYSRAKKSTQDHIWTNMAARESTMGASQTGSEELPPLSDTHYKLYNNLAERMDYVHTHFRHTWTFLWKTVAEEKRLSELELSVFIQTGIDLARQLTAHHRTEERLVFPILGKKMVEFRPDEGPLLGQHEMIHEGIEVFETYLRQCQDGEVTFEPSALRERMESWGEVLWTHLDQEVATLAAENMRKYWSIDEIRAMPW